ncbi:MAG: hypothetical protein LBV06_03085 [Propionibacteriaceae bacterium]|jgi:primosomal protein N' (replication factor Y)|nr:hypothetical protein [Propionibacteriaceae bacterium]
MTLFAQVYVDTGVSHLDHPFDYEVPEQWRDQVRPGVRVKVHFNGRLLSGLVAATSQTTQLPSVSPLTKVVSPQVVAPAQSLRLIRAVADHCAGSFMDVARLAIPPRSARAEAHSGQVIEDPTPAILVESALDGYPQGSGLRAALRGGQSPRALWTLTPVADQAGDWADGLASVVADTVHSGRAALVIVPDAKDCSVVLDRVRHVVDRRLVVSLTADTGPQARYSAYLAAVRGQARVVVGTRAAAYVPLPDLGLIAVWDEADASLAEPHAPYPAVRDVVALRASQERVGVVFAANSQSTHLQNWLERGWLQPVTHPSSVIRRLAPSVRIASQTDRALDQDALARQTRLPHDVFPVITQGLTRGPVLVWVPWLGNRRNFWCSQCGEPMRCVCGGCFEEREASVLACQLCGRTADQWACSCGSTRWRAVTTGSARTQIELARAFPAAKVIRSDSTENHDRIADQAAIVIATPGCEPVVAGGYAALVILDAVSFLSRPDIRAGEEAVRRWLNAIALVAPGERSGTVLIVGPARDRAVQAVLRLDAAGYAARELADRREAGFPPATRMAVFTGSEAIIQQVEAHLAEAGFVSTLPPVLDMPDESGQVLARLTARVEASQGDRFARLIATIVARRGSARAGKLVFRLDPQWLGG